MFFLLNGLVFIFIIFVATPSQAIGPAPENFRAQTSAYIEHENELRSQWRTDPDQPRLDYTPQEDGIEETLVIRVDFSDHPGERPASDFEQAFFGEETSLRAYYSQLSRESETRMSVSYPDGEPPIFPADGSWVRMPENMAYYGQPDPGGRYPDYLSRLKEMTQSALHELITEIDFSQYDHDNDNTLDHLVIVHSGNDEAESYIANDLWSLRFSATIGYYQNILINSVIVVAENPDSNVPIGTICHEFFHEFGAPDIYDYHLDGESGEPVGAWSLMGNGSFFGEGQKPAAICGYLQMDFDGNPNNGLRGWIIPTDIDNSATDIEIDRLGDSSTRSLYRIYIPGTDNSEYFLIENRCARETYMYDRELPGSDGLLIWHIDEGMTTDSYPYPIGFNDGPGLTPYYRVWLEDSRDPDHTGSYTLDTASFSLDQNRSYISRVGDPNTAGNSDSIGMFRIYGVGYSGEIMKFSVDFESEDIPTEKQATRNFPNPFRTWTKIEFDLPEPEACTFAVYNISGQRVHYRNLGTVPEGSYFVVWNGRHSDGQQASMGKYFYELKLGETKEYGPMIWMPEK